MCLNCAISQQPNIRCLLRGEDLKKEFANPGKVYLRKPDNTVITLSLEQQKEIHENAVVIVVTGVDLMTDIWGIQWPNDYKVKTL